MARSNKSTAAQRNFIASLARTAGDEKFNEAFATAAAINCNAPRSHAETVTQATNRLSKTAASRLIDELKNN